MKYLATRSALIALALATVNPAVTYAQAVYGSIVGTVTDPTGAVVAGAKLTITDTGRDVTVSTTSNDSGNYTQRFLIAGRYRVRVEASGFKTYVQDNIGVSVDTETKLDILMQVGEVTQTMEVTGEASVLKTERSDVATTWSDKTVSNIPTLNRKFSNFQLMTPGVVAWPTSNTVPAAENPQGAYRMLVNGQSFAGTSHLLDGTDNHDAVLGWLVINPTLESVTEAKITTANYDAEFGVASAGVVSAQTKSGTNAIHGSVFEFMRNNVMQARNPFTQSKVIPGSNGRTIPLTQWNQFGASIGGPIIKNKLFYFGDFQGSRRNTGGGGLFRVPSAEERQGDLSSLNVPIYDPLSGPTPATRQRFAGDRIPVSRLSTQSLNLLKLIPLPNAPAILEQPNYASSGGVKYDDESYNVRVDHFTTDKLHLFGRYTLQQFRILAPGSYGLLAGGGGLDASGSTTAFAGKSDTRNQSIASGFDYALRPNLLTDFRFGWVRYKVFVQPNGIGQAPAKDAGIPGLNVDDNFNSGMPGFFINNYGSVPFRFGYALGVNGCNCPLIQDEKQVQFVNNWTKIQGNHTIKFGADIRRAFNLRIPSDRHRSGELNFDPSRTQGATGGSGLATFLLGDVSRFERYVSNSLDARETQNRWFFYGQDSWKVTRKLTINYGLRWEIYRPQYVNGNSNGGFVDLATGEVKVAGVNGVGRDLNVKSPLTTFAPRLGIAYQLNQKTVIRTGYGRGFNLGVFGSIFGHNVTQNLPVLGIQSTQPANNYDAVFKLDQGPTALDPASILASQPKGPNGFNRLPNGVTAFVITDPIRFPTVDSWNFTIQRQLGQGMSAEVGYVGSKGTHVFAGNGGDYDPNQADVNGFGTLTTNQRKPFFQKFGWSQNLRYYGSDASNNYHSIQLKFDKRFASGLSLMTHYTFSKNIDYTNTYYPLDAKLARGVSDFNRPMIFFLATVYELPFGKGRKHMNNAPKVVDMLLGGWQANSTYNWMAGQPFTPSYRDCNADRDTGWCRPHLVGDYSVSDPSQFGWFKTASVPLTSNLQTDGPWQRPARGTFGTVGRNEIAGPSFQQWDMSFFKTFAITEKHNLQFRAESYNFANKTNLANPNGCVDCPGVAGRIFGAFAAYVPRQWQLGLRYSF